MDMFMNRMDRIIVEKQEDWFKWISSIPYLSFPSDWQVAIIPPFCGAIVRFRVRTEKMPIGHDISVYLDCLDVLGSVGTPYWEVFPVCNEAYRCSLHETDSLVKAIQKGIDSVMEEIIQVT
jgi:hypothetical protein